MSVKCLWEEIVGDWAEQALPRNHPMRIRKPTPTFPDKKLVLLEEAITLIGMLRSFILCGDRLDEERDVRISKFIDDFRSVQKTDSPK